MKNVASSIIYTEGVDNIVGEGLEITDNNVADTFFLISDAVGGTV